MDNWAGQPSRDPGAHLALTNKISLNEARTQQEENQNDHKET